MNTIVHGRKRNICQWTGEALDNENKFKVPKEDLSGKFIGCYGSPGVCLAYMSVLATRLNMAKDKQSEWIDKFINSLRRTEFKKEMEYTIKVAPLDPVQMLSIFEGKMSLEEFHALYEHDLQILLFKQVLPLKEKKKEKSSWKVTKFGSKNRNDDGVPCEAVVPKNYTNWRNFISCMKNPTIATHPTKLDLMCFWDYSNGLDGRLNSKACKIMDRTDICGSCSIFHKRKLERKKKTVSDKIEKPKIVKSKEPAKKKQKTKE